MGLSKELQIGKAGEHLVCCDLIQQGYNAFLADQGLPNVSTLKKKGKQNMLSENTQNSKQSIVLN